MITYKYSLAKELKMIIHNYKRKKSLIKKSVVFMDFNAFKFVSLFIRFKLGKIKFPEIDVPENIVCYIVSCGTWGAYEPPASIFICLNNLENLHMKIEELIFHEIVHLRLESKLKDFDFDMKEKVINKEVDRLMGR